MMQRNTSLFFIICGLALFSRAATAKPLHELCDPFSAEKFKLFGSDEIIDWEVALQTTNFDDLRDLARERARVADGEETFSGIDQAREIATSKGTFRVVVVAEPISMDIAAYIESVRLLADKPFMPQFFGCQVDPKKNRVYIVQQDTAHLPHLVSQTDRVAFQALSRTTRLQLYRQLFDSLREMNSIPFVSVAIRPAAVTYSLSEGNIQLLFRDSIFVSKDSNALLCRLDFNFWRPKSFATYHRVSLSDSLFAAALTLLELENPKKLSIFDQVIVGRFPVFDLKHPMQKNSFLGITRSILLNARLGDPITCDPHNWETSRLACLLMGVVKQSSTCPQTSKMLSIIGKALLAEAEVQLEEVPQVSAEFSDESPSEEEKRLLLI